MTKSDRRCRQDAAETTKETDARREGKKKVSSSRGEGKTRGGGRWEEGKKIRVANFIPALVL